MSHQIPVFGELRLKDLREGTYFRLRLGLLKETIADYPHIHRYTLEGASALLCGISGTLFCTTCGCEVGSTAEREGCPVCDHHQQSAQFGRLNYHVFTDHGYPGLKLGEVIVESVQHRDIFCYHLRGALVYDQDVEVWFCHACGAQVEPLAAEAGCPHCGQRKRIPIYGKLRYRDLEEGHYVGLALGACLDRIDGDIPIHHYQLVGPAVTRADQMTAFFCLNCDCQIDVVSCDEGCPNCNDRWVGED